jgi:hypothetical protein
MFKQGMGDLKQIKDLLTFRPIAGIMRWATSFFMLYSPASTTTSCRLAASGGGPNTLKELMNIQDAWIVWGALDSRRRHEVTVANLSDGTIQFTRQRWVYLMRRCRKQ